MPTDDLMNYTWFSGIYLGQKAQLLMALNFTYWSSNEFLKEKTDFIIIVILL